LSPFEATWAALAFDGEVRWFAKRGQRAFLGGVAHSPAELEGTLYANRKGYDCYVQLNPTVGFRGLRATAADVSHFRGCLLDLDPDPGIRVVAVGVSDATARVLSVQLLTAPTMLDSGRGAQAWFLGNPFSPSRPDWRNVVRRSVSNLVRGLSLPAGVHADPMVCDVSRVARMPGTVNHKTGRVASITLPGEPSAALYDRLEALDPGEAEGPAPELENSHDSYRQVWGSLTRMAQDFITEGWTYPGRHSAMWHTAALLRERGLTRPAAARALWLGASTSRPKLTWSEVQYALGRTYGAHEKV
jgi:hypothetical protein